MDNYLTLSDLMKHLSQLNNTEERLKFIDKNAFWNVCTYRRISIIKDINDVSFNQFRDYIDKMIDMLKIGDYIYVEWESSYSKMNVSKYIYMGDYYIKEAVFKGYYDGTCNFYKQTANIVYTDLSYYMKKGLISKVYVYQSIELLNP